MNDSVSERIFWELSNRGFGSEINNLLYAINFSKKKNIPININSESWNISLEKGWTDYFEDSINETSINHFTVKVYKWLSKHFGLNKLISSKSSKKLKVVRYLHLNITLTILRLASFRKIHFTPNIFNEVRDFNRKEFRDDRDVFLSEMNKILNEIWIFNYNTENHIQKIYNDLNLKEYAAIHVRRGDKVLTNEDSIYSIETYIKKVIDAGISNVFVMSDDYRVYEDAKLKYPDLCFKCLIDKKSFGHSQKAFNSNSKEILRKRTLDLITEIEIARNSVIFIGSSNSNIYRLIEYFKISDCLDIKNFDSEFDF